VLDGDRRGHQLEVVRPDPANHVLERLVKGQSQIDLADDPTELGGDGWARLANDEFDGPEE